jgi:hypothetical protein
MRQQRVINRDRCPIGLRACILCYWRSVRRCTFPPGGYDIYGQPRMNDRFERYSLDNRGKYERKLRQEVRAAKENPKQNLPKSKQHDKPSVRTSGRR